MPASIQATSNAAETARVVDTHDRTATSAAATVHDPPRPASIDREMEEMIEIPADCSANPDRRVVVDYQVNHNEDEITLEVQSAGQNRPHRTVPITAKGKVTFYDHFHEFKRFHKLDFATEVPSPKTTSDYTKYIYQCVGDAAPFKYKACTENGLFTTCVVYPFYSTKTVTRACVNCFLRRRGATCEHNPDRVDPELANRASQQGKDHDENVPLAHGIKPALPAPTAISAEQIRALHALGLIIAPVESLPHTKAPQSQRQADEKCQKAVGLIHQRLAEYQKHHRDDVPLLQIIDTTKEATAPSAIDKSPLASQPKPAHKKKKLYKTKPELGKRQRSEIAFSKPYKKPKDSTTKSGIHGSSEALSQQQSNILKTAESVTDCTTASLPAPVVPTSASTSVPTATVLLPPSASSQASPAKEKKKKSKKSKKDKKHKKENKDRKEGKHSKHHHRHSSSGPAAGAGTAIAQASPAGKQALGKGNAVPAAQAEEELASPNLSINEETSVAENATAPPGILSTDTIKAQDHAESPRTTGSPTRRSGDCVDVLKTPVPKPITPVQTLTKLVPKSRPSTNVKEPAPRPRYENHDLSPLRRSTSMLDTAQMQRCQDSPATLASRALKMVPPKDQGLDTISDTSIVDQGRTVSSANAELSHSFPNTTSIDPISLLSSSSPSQNTAIALDDSDDESDASANTALKSFLPSHSQVSAQRSGSSYSPQKVSRHGIVYTNVTEKDMSAPIPWSVPVEEHLPSVPTDGIVIAYHRGSLLPPAPHTPSGEPPLGRLDDGIYAQCEHELAERCAWSFPVVRSSKQYFAMSSQEHDILRGNEWYDDIIISCYMHLLHSSHSPRAQRLFGWVDSVLVNDILRRRVDEHPFPAEWTTCLKELREARFIIAPTNLHKHWVLLAFDKRTRSFVVGDSAVVSRSFGFARKLVDPLLSFFRQHKIIPTIEGTDTWKYLGNPLPPQDTSYDCGPYVCAGAKLLWETGDISCKLSFTQKDVTAFRSQMLAELVIGKAVGFNPCVGIAATTVEHEKESLKYSLPGSPRKLRTSQSVPPSDQATSDSRQALPASGRLPVNRQLEFKSALSVPSTPLSANRKTRPMTSSPLKVVTNVPISSSLPAPAGSSLSPSKTKENAPQSTTRKVLSFSPPTTAQESSLTNEYSSPPITYPAPSSPLSEKTINELDALSGDKAISCDLQSDNANRNEKLDDSTVVARSCDVIVEDPCASASPKNHVDTAHEATEFQWTAINAPTMTRQRSPSFREVRLGVDPRSPSSKKHPFFKPATIKVPVKDTRPIDPNPEGLTPEERYAYENITPEEGRSMMTIPMHKFPMPELPHPSSPSVDADKPIKQEPSADDNVLRTVPAVDDNYVVYQPKPRKAPKPPKTISSAWIVGVSKNWGRRKKAGPYEGVYRKQRKR